MNRLQKRFEARIRLAEAVTWKEPIWPTMLALRSAGIDYRSKVFTYIDNKSEEKVFIQYA